MFHLLVLSLLASNVYSVAAVTLNASLLTQLGYNNKSSYIFINGNDITDIDSDAFNGYNQLTTFTILSSSLSKIDLGVFKDLVNLETLDLRYNPLSQLTNSKKITFPFLQVLDLNGCPLANLDSNVVNSLPNLVKLVVYNSNPIQLSPLKINQLSSWKKLLGLYISTKNQKSLTKAHFNGINSLIELSFANSNIKTIEVHTLLALPNVTFVDFTNNELTSLEYLQIPKKLETLYLQGNKLNYFRLSRTMGAVKVLTLQNNQFRSFKSMDFTFLANLMQIDLSNNPHAYPNEIASNLKPLVNLISVRLNNLSISSIDSNYFKQNTKLQYITLTNKIIK